MIDKEHYWSAEALWEITDRVETLCHIDVDEGLEAAGHAMEILERRVLNPTADLRGKTLAVFAIALRHVGRLSKSLETYETALAIPGLSERIRGYILRKMTVPLVCLGRSDEALLHLNSWLQDRPDDLPTLSIRAWVRMVHGKFEESLKDSIRVLEISGNGAHRNRSVVAAAVNGITVISYDAGIRVDESVLDRFHLAVLELRGKLPKNGTSFHKTRPLRLALKRAEALLLARTSIQCEKSARKVVKMLDTVVEGLAEKHPDDALDASLDLMCFHARLGEIRAAVEESERALCLTRSARAPLTPSAVNILTATVERADLDAFLASELRFRLRLRESDHPRTGESPSDPGRSS